jgi:hypothetical protein
MIATLTSAERRVLHALHSRAWSECVSRNVLCVRRDLERRMLSKGLISKRAFSKGYIAATMAGRSRYEATSPLSSKHEAP